MKILVIHGPNLNMLGVREPAVYGRQTLEDINKTISEYADKLGIMCEIFQSNYEGAIIDEIQSANGNFDGIILNAGAYTHYSYALRDALSSISVPCVEVHISNIQTRDDFRKNSVIAPVCIGSICGFGIESYLLALQAFYLR